MEEKKTSTAKRVACLVLAVLVLGLAIATTFFLINGFNGKKTSSPEATPDNSGLVDPSVKVPEEKAPNEFLVDAAFVMIDVILVIFIVFVLVRKPKARKSRGGEDSSDSSEHTG